MFIYKKGTIMKHSTEVKLNVFGSVVLANHVLSGTSNRQQQYFDRFSQQQQSQVAQKSSNSVNPINVMK